MSGQMAFCPMCGNRVQLTDQRYCATCGQPLATGVMVVAVAPAGQTHGAPIRAAGSAQRAGAQGRPFLELGLAVVGAVSLLLPFMSVSASAITYSALSQSNSYSASISVADSFLHNSSRPGIELWVILGGCLAALVVAGLRAMDSRSFGPRVTFAAFAVMFGGFAWVLLEWNDVMGKAIASYSGTLTINQAFGFWVGLAAAVAGALVCIVPDDRLGLMGADLSRLPSPAQDS